MHWYVTALICLSLPACGLPLTDIAYGEAPGAVNATRSYITINPNTGIVADGHHTSTVSVVLRDGNNIPIPHVPVTVAATDTGSPGFLASLSTDETGTASTTVSSIFTGSKQINAFSGSLALHGNVTFVAPTSTCTGYTSFFPPPLFTAMQSTSFLPSLMGDLNGDGLRDLVFTNPPNNSVSIALNLGEGRFAAPTSTATGANPERVAVCDLNNDTFLDVATVNTTAGTVTAILNTGAGTFGKTSTAQVSKTAMTTVGIWCNDVTADSNNDIIVSDYAHSAIVVMPGDGGGGFNPNITTTVAAAPWDLRTNAAGGVIFYVDNTGFLYSMTKAGGGMFNAPTAFAVNANTNVDVAIQDINGDNFPDAVTANPNDNTLSVLFAQGNITTFKFAYNIKLPTTPATGLKQGPVSVVFGNWNKDGYMDLATVSRATGLVYTMLGAGNGNFSTPVAYHSGFDPIFVRAVDINNDSFPDLAILHASSSVSFLLNHNGDGTFVDTPTYATNDAPAAVNAIDVTHDGLPDLLVTNTGTSPSVQLFVGKADGSFTAGPSYALPSQSFKIATPDINADGWADIVVSTGSPASGLQVLLNQENGTFGAPMNEQANGNCSGVAVGDFNQDGLLDLATGNSLSNNVSVLLAQAAGRFALPVQYSVGATHSGPVDLTVTDINGDGHQDIVVALVSSERVGVLFGVGDGTFTNTVYAGDVTSLTGINAVCSADFNLDGYPDVSAVDLGNTNSYVDVFLGGSSGSLTTSTGLALPAHATTLFVNDVTGDGTPDLVIPDASNARFFVSPGNGDGNFAAPRAYGAGNAPYGAALADFNGDGHVDAAVTNANDNTLTLHMGIACP